MSLISDYPGPILQKKSIFYSITPYLISGRKVDQPIVWFTVFTTGFVGSSEEYSTLKLNAIKL
jgi:hypothetical protein